MRLINITFEIEDNIFIEDEFRNLIQSKFGGHIKGDIKTLANTDHLKDNTHFKALLKVKRNAQLNLDRYINENREL